MFVAFVSQDWFGDRQCQNELAYAKALKKPVRFLVLGGVQVPKKLYQDIADFAMARVSSADLEHAAAIVQGWLEEEL